MSTSSRFFFSKMLMLSIPLRMMILLLVVVSASSSRRTIDRPPAMKLMVRQQRTTSPCQQNNEHLFLSFIPLRRRQRRPPSSPNATTESSSSSPPSLNYKIALSEIRSTTLVIIAIETAIPFFLIMIDSSGCFLSWLGNVLKISYTTIIGDGIKKIRCFARRIDVYLKQHAEEENDENDDGGFATRSGVMSWNAQMVLFLVASAEAIWAIVFDKQHAIMKRTDAIKSAIGIRPFPPRQLFVVGACSRGLQLCTRIQYAFDPSIGVCGLINLGAMWAKCRWVSRIIVGWGLTPLLWKVCGARVVPRRPKKKGGGD